MTWWKGKRNWLPCEFLFLKFLKKETSYPLEPYGCIRHKTRSMELYYPTLMEESRGDFDNNGYIRS